MVAKEIKRAGNGFQRIVNLMSDDSGPPSHRCQSLCFAKGILRFQLSGNVPVHLKDCIAACLERFSACDGYFLTFAGKLSEIPTPFTGLCECALHVTESIGEPGLENLVDRFA